MLAAAVLEEIDLIPRDDAVLLTGSPLVRVPWEDLCRAYDEALGRGPELALRAVVRHLVTRRVAADLGAAELGRRARPVGLPVGHVGHPGAGWVREEVLGGALELGLGYVGVRRDPDRVELLDDVALLAADVAPAAWWSPARAYLEQMGEVALARLLRSGPLGPGSSGVLRPIGDADVVTLLGARSLRRGLAEADGTGMRAIAVPMLRRGWLDLRAVDPAFAGAAASATSEEERGFLRPVLVTADEVSLAPDGRPEILVLRDLEDRSLLPG